MFQQPRMARRLARQVEEEKLSWFYGPYEDNSCMRQIVGWEMWNRERKENNKLKLPILLISLIHDTFAREKDLV